MFLQDLYLQDKTKSSNSFIYCKIYICLSYTFIMSVETPNIELPFYMCNQTDLPSNVLHKKVIRFKNLFEELPFSKCSDFTIISECMSNRNRFFQLFENNEFLHNCQNIIDETFNNLYSCRYYNEDSFNLMIKISRKCIEIVPL